MDTRTIWIVTAAASMGVATLSIALTYYPPMTTRFWAARYRKVAGVDHVGPALELGMTSWLWASITFLVLFIFREQGRKLVEGALPGELYIALGVFAFLLLLATLQYCLVLSPREHDRMIRLDASLLAPLPADTRERLLALGGELAKKPGAVEKESWKTRLIYLPYTFYCYNNLLLAVVVLLLLTLGLRDDARAWWDARDQLAGAALPASQAPLDDGFFKQAQSYLAHFVTYQDLLLQLAKKVMAGVAALLVPFIWFLGTSFQTIYTTKVVAAMRAFARVLVIFLVVAMAFCYFHLAYTADRVNSEVWKIAKDRQTESLNLEQLRKLNDFRITVSNEATVDDFWARLANSYGGLFFLLATVISILRKRRMGTSFMSLLIPRPLRLRNNAFLRAVVTMPQEPAAGAERGGAEGGQGSREEPR